MSAIPGRPSVSAACSGSVGEPTVVTGTSVEPYTRVTDGRSKYAAALRISDGGHRSAAADEHLQIGQPGAGALGRGQQLSRNGVAPAMCVQRSACIRATAASGVPALHQHRGACRAAAGIRRRRSTRRCGRWARAPGTCRPARRASASPIWRISASIELWVCRTPFGPAGGARGVQDHPHRVGVQRRQRPRCAGSRRTASRRRCGRRRRRGPPRPPVATPSRPSPGSASPRSRGRGTCDGMKIIRLSASSRMNCSSWSRSDGRIGFTTMPASVAPR